MSTIGVDCRMVFHSGIGTYIRNVVPRVVRTLSEFHFRLLVPRDFTDTGLFHGENVELCYGKSEIYSIREQVELIRFARSNGGVNWSPHYVIPIAGQVGQLTVVHDTFHLSMPQFLGGYHQKLYARMMFEMVKRRSTHVICVSEFTASELKRHLGIAEDRITVIHNGVDGSWSSMSKTAPVHPRPYILYVGNVKPHKNIGRLINAFMRVSARIPHDLLIVGATKGFILSDRSVQVISSQNTDRIRILGQVSDMSLRQFVCQADALVLPSLYEGFGLPALEAMASGCPVAVSNRASLPEVCGNAALYFDPEDEECMGATIVRIVEDREHRSRLVHLGFARVKQFSWDDAASKTVELLRRVSQGAGMSQPVEQLRVDAIHDAS